MCWAGSFEGAAVAIRRASRTVSHHPRMWHRTWHVFPGEPGRYATRNLQLTRTIFVCVAPNFEKGATATICCVFLEGPDSPSPPQIQGELDGEIRSCSVCDFVGRNPKKTEDDGMPHLQKSEDGHVLGRLF